MLGFFGAEVFLRSMESVSFIKNLSTLLQTDRSCSSLWNSAVLPSPLLSILTVWVDAVNARRV